MPSAKQAARPVMLLVDDDPIFLEIAQTYFTQAGFEVIAMGDALSALSAVEALPASLDCVVSDIWLPSGTPHGVSLANMLSVRFPQVVRVFVSGDLKARDHVGTAPVFIKPVDFDAIATALRDLLKNVQKK